MNQWSEIELKLLDAIDGICTRLVNMISEQSAEISGNPQVNFEELRLVHWQESVLRNAVILILQNMEKKAGQHEKANFYSDVMGKLSEEGLIETIEDLHRRQK